ncbi:MAG TPA: hypothetical protein VN823_15040 [Stellaceae bacterium]|nr:hypothetical protein [Stellaceae bacterium]
MKWSAANARDIRQKGWTLLPRRVSAALVECARELIAEDFTRDPPRDDEEWEKCGAGTFCKRLVVRDALNFLATESGALAFAAQAIDHLHDGLGAQVARRRRGDAGVPHIDGFYPEDDEPANTPDAIIGIYLTDVTRREHGAFTVWPKARERIARWARGHEELPNRSDGTPPLGRLGKSAALLGRRGTAFLAHGALPHCNLRRETRGYRDAVFFRLYRRKPYRDVLTLLRSGGTGW